MTLTKRQESILKYPVWGVMYRGNGYGPFLSEERAKRMSPIIKYHNEKYLGGKKMSDVEPTIYSFPTLLEYLDICE